MASSASSMRGKRPRETDHLAQQLIDAGVSQSSSDASDIASALQSTIGYGHHNAVLSTQVVTPHSLIATCSPRHGDVEPSETARSILLIGRLSPANLSHLNSEFPADIGTIALHDISDNCKVLACSASANAVPTPAQLGCVVLATSWSLISDPHRPYLELHGELRTLQHTEVLLPPLPRSWSVAEARAVVRGSGSAKLLALRGELTAISEPFGTREPVFFAELSSHEQTDKACCHQGIRGRCQSGRRIKGDGLSRENECAKDEISDTYATSVAFVGSQAAQWRGVLQLGRVYMFTNLRRAYDYSASAIGRRRSSRLAAASHCTDAGTPVFRSSSDECHHPEHRTAVHLIDHLHGPRASTRSSADSFVECSERASELPRESSQLPTLTRDVFSAPFDARPYSQLPSSVSQSERLSSHSEHSQPQSADHSAACCNNLVNYEGTITGWRGPYAAELDTTFILLLSHVAKQSRLGMRVGARVFVSNAHPLHAPANETHSGARLAEDSAKWELIGFGLCARGSMHVLEHAGRGTLPPTDVDSDVTAAVNAHEHAVSRLAKSSQSVLTSRLASQLNLAELAAVWSGLLMPHGLGELRDTSQLGARRPSMSRDAVQPCSWADRWNGVLTAKDQADALSELLACHGLSEQGSYVAQSLPACLRQESDCQSSERKRRCAYGEFTRHPEVCQLVAARVLPPMLPSLAIALAALKSFPEIVQAIKNVRANGHPQLVMRAQIEGRAPSLVGCIGREDELTATACEHPSWELRDASAAVPLSLPESDHVSVRCGVWVIVRYHILVEPDSHLVGAPPTLHIWTRLQPPEPWLVPNAKPLCQLAKEKNFESAVKVTADDDASISVRELVAMTFSTRTHTPGKRGGSRCSTPFDLVDVRCVLHSRTRKDDGTHVWRLADADGSIIICAYVDSTLKRLPVGILPGCELVLRRAQLWVSTISQNRYLRLDGRTIVRDTRFEAANLYDDNGSCDKTHLQTFCPLNHEAGLEQASVSQAGLFNYIQDALLQDVYRGRIGATNSGGALCFRFTVVRICEFYLHARCAACGQVQQGHRCACMLPAGRQRCRPRGMSRVEVEANVRVSDGSAHAYVCIRGCSLWTLLRVSSTSFAQLHDVTDRCGPISCKSRSGSRGCLSSPDVRQWTFGNSSQVRSEDRSVLAAVWPLPTASWREVQSHCRIVHLPSHNIRRTVVRLAASCQEYPALVPEGFVSLEACDIVPITSGSRTDLMSSIVANELARASIPM